MKKIFFAIPVLVMFLACNDKKLYPYVLKCDTKSEFIIYLDSITPPSTMMIQFFESQFRNNPSISFAMLNEQSQTINIHNNRGKKIREINLLKRDSTLHKTTGFYFIDEDSLLLYSYKGREMSLLSCNNKFEKKVLFNLENLNDSTVRKLVIEVASVTPILYKNGSIYLTGRALYNDLSKPHERKKVATAISFNIHSKTANYISLFEKAWDDRYWHFEQYFVNHTFLPKENMVIYSLAMKDSVIRFDVTKKNQIKLQMKSDDIGNESEMIPKLISDVSIIGEYDDVREYLKKPRYGQLIFDKYRNIYYRFVSFGDKNLVTNLIICDKNFKKIGETTLPRNYLAGAGFFLVKEGLFLRKCNIKDESKIIYTLFKLTKNT